MLAQHLVRCCHARPCCRHGKIECIDPTKQNIPGAASNWWWQIHFYEAHLFKHHSFHMASVEPVLMGVGVVLSAPSFCDFAVAGSGALVLLALLAARPRLGPGLLGLPLAFEAGRVCSSLMWNLLGDG
jgi:hypothetical protein